MVMCNLEMSDTCYGCSYYGTGDVEGCKLTIEFYKRHPIHTDEEYKEWMISNNRVNSNNTMEALKKFTSLPHLSGDLKQMVEDWAYTPNLYHFDGMWHVDWIHCEDGNSAIGFSADTPEEAIDKAYNWFNSSYCNNL